MHPKSKVTLQPSISFPYIISRRIHLLSFPRKTLVCSKKVPSFTPHGVRVSALKSHISDRVREAAWPYVHKLLKLRAMYRRIFDKNRLERLDRMIQASNKTQYSRLSTKEYTLKNSEISSKKKYISVGEWKRHAEYIDQIAKPRKVFLPDPLDRGPRKPLNELLPHLTRLSEMPHYKIHKRLSEQSWYRKPGTVSKKALTYVISDRMNVLATPKKKQED